MPNFWFYKRVRELNKYSSIQNLYNDKKIKQILILMINDLYDRLTYIHNCIASRNHIILIPLHLCCREKHIFLFSRGPKNKIWRVGNKIWAELYITLEGILFSTVLLLSAVMDGGLCWQNVDNCNCGLHFPSLTLISFLFSHIIWTNRQKHIVCYTFQPQHF